MPATPSATTQNLRQRAEKKLRVRKAAERALKQESLVFMDSVRNYHELQVHQVELEMQYDELRQTQVELELSRNKYTKLYAEKYDFASNGYFTFDARGMIRKVNLTDAQLLAIESGCLVDKPASTFIADADAKEIFYKHFETIAKRLETEIQDAQEFAENIVETVREPLVVLSSDLKILTANQSYYETFKVIPETTIGNFIYDVGNRQWDIPKLRVLFEDILPNNTAFNGYEVEHDFPGIGHKFILLNARQIFRKNIGSHIILLAMEDITERKQAEDELRQSHTRLASFAEATFEAIVESDAGRIVDCNEQLALMLDYPAEELRGMEIAGLIAPEDRDWVVENVQQNLESIIEYALLRKDGTRVLVEAHGCPMSPGSVKRYTAIRDITESKQAKKTIHESEEKFRSIFEQSLDAIFISLKDGSIDAANPAACKMFGMTEQELFKAGRAGIVNHADHRLALVIEEKKRTGGTIAELTFIRKNGEQFPAEISSVKVPDEPQRSIIIVRDITERKIAEHTLQKAHCELELKVEERTEELASTVDSLLNEIFEREKAESALRVETDERLKAMEDLREKERMLIQQSRQAAIGEMIGNIAHQWRQPLNALGLNTQKLGIFYGQPIFNKEFLDSSVAKSMLLIQHMSKTIDDFRDYFKPDNEKSEFSVREAVNNTLSLLEGSFQNPRILIEIVENHNPVINGYQNEFAQVILNILINARDALIEREIDDARVLITVCSENGCAVVTVADNAGGIPEEIIDKVFDPYFTTKDPQLGTGIGLFMSKTIIEKNMGGRLIVRNTATGAEFRIEVGDETQN